MNCFRLVSTRRWIETQADADNTAQSRFRLVSTRRWIETRSSTMMRSGRWVSVWFRLGGGLKLFDYAQFVVTNFVSVWFRLGGGLKLVMRMESCRTARFRLVSTRRWIETAVVARWLDSCNVSVWFRLGGGLKPPVACSWARTRRFPSGFD